MEWGRMPIDFENEIRHRIDFDILISQMQKRLLDFLHPELKEGEKFSGNISEFDIDLLVNPNRQRVGTIAYDIQGNAIKGLAPVFELPKVNSITKAIRES